MNAATALPPGAVHEHLEPGDVLGCYQLLCPVGQGGMGQIWVSRRTDDTEPSRLFAVKTVLPRVAQLYKDVDVLFREEARIATAVDHPNVCRAYELGEDGGILFLAMDWIDGGSLATLVSELDVSRQRLDFALAAYVVAQACAGMHAVHELTDERGARLNPVHRDATPHNLLISSAGDVKLIDFGVVKAHGGERSRADANELKGKIAYLSPEQLLSKCVDRRTDIFALGCVLYYVSTCKRAFNGNTPEETMRHIAQGEYAPPSCLVSGYPGELEAIVARALAVSPDDRFPTADHMREQLEVFIARSGAWVAGRSELARVLTTTLGPALDERRNEIRLARQLFESPRAGSAFRPASARSASLGEFARVSPLSLGLRPWRASRWPHPASAGERSATGSPCSQPAAPDPPHPPPKPVAVARSGVVLGRAPCARARSIVLSAALACVLGQITQPQDDIGRSPEPARPMLLNGPSSALDSPPLVASNAADAASSAASTPAPSASGPSVRQCTAASMPPLASTLDVPPPTSSLGASPGKIRNASSASLTAAAAPAPRPPPLSFPASASKGNRWGASASSARAPR